MRMRMDGRRGWRAEDGEERACGAGMVAQAVAVSSRALGGCGCASLEQASKEKFNLKIDFPSLPARAYGVTGYHFGL